MPSHATALLLMSPPAAPCTSLASERTSLDVDRALRTTRPAQIGADLLRGELYVTRPSMDCRDGEPERCRNPFERFASRAKSANLVAKFRPSASVRHRTYVRQTAGRIWRNPAA